MESSCLIAQILFVLSAGMKKYCNVWYSSLFSVITQTGHWFFSDIPVTQSLKHDLFIYFTFCGVAQNPNNTLKTCHYNILWVFGQLHKIGNKQVMLK